VSLQVFGSVKVDVAEFFVVKACSLVGGTFVCIPCREDEGNISVGPQNVVIHIQVCTAL
jgi:hypothetical protein